VATSKKPKAVVGVFSDHADADRAVEELRRAGFRDSQIGVVYRDKGGKRKKNGKGETYAEEGATAGVLAGAGAGALVGLGILAGAIPGIGPAIAGGTLGVLLSNAALGAAVAGLAGALIGLGIPEDEAEWYESELKAGRTIVTVKATSRQAEAREILRRHNSYDATSVRTTTDEVCETMPRRTSTAARRTGGDETIEVREEELETRKRPVKTGEVRVRKDVVTEHKTIDVPVRREEVVIERRRTGGRAASGASMTPEEIRIPVHGEEVDVEKRTVAKEEVKVGKRTVQDKEKVSGTVRREKVRVDSTGDTNVRERQGARR
jgi:uncharacterized protein (TIGR02271 family)